VCGAGGGERRLIERLIEHLAWKANTTAEGDRAPRR
jgi:hypothetical protein